MVKGSRLKKSRIQILKQVLAAAGAGMVLIAAVSNGIALDSKGVASVSVSPAAGAPAAAHQSPAQQAHALTIDGKFNEATALLKTALQRESDPQRHALLQLALGLHFYAHFAASDAEAALRAALDENVGLPAYAILTLARIHRDGGKLDLAKTEFEKVLTYRRLPLATIIDVRLSLASIAIDEKNWSSALARLMPIEKVLRNDERHAQLVYNLMLAEKGLQHRRKMCLWARALYVNHPAFILIRDWGAKLQEASVDGERLGCVASAQDMKARVRRLELSGESERAEAGLVGATGPAANFDDRELISLVNHWINDGRVDEALALLLQRDDAKKNSVQFQMVLGKALTRKGDYPAAASAYLRAYEIAPRAPNASVALFQAGFTHYQMQDYERANQQFTLLLKQFKTSKYTRDTRWYLAWMQYLKADYKTALESFKKLSLLKPAVVKRRKRRRKAEPIGDALSRDRLSYWSAVCLLKLNRQSEAVSIFQKLALDPAIGYYAILAYERLHHLPGAVATLPPIFDYRWGLRATNANPTLNDGLTEADILKAALTDNDLADGSDSTDGAINSAIESSKDEASADESADESVDAGTDSATNGATDVASASAVSEFESDFKGPGLASSFSLVRDLEFVGLDDEAGRMLVEIERHVHTPDDRRLLMKEFSSAQRFERSSTIGELGFVVPRLRTGLSGSGRVYWEYAFPRAFDSDVVEAAKLNSIPEALIWSIMRAESHYRVDARSNVGALGLMQLMPFTGHKLAELSGQKSFESNSLLQASVNIQYGAKYLKRLMDRFGNSVPLVAASYNAGPHRVHAWVKNFGSLEMDEFIEHIPFFETRNYVKKVSRNFLTYGLLYHRDPESVHWLVEPVGVRMQGPIPSHEVWDP